MCLSTELCDVRSTVGTSAWFAERGRALAFISQYGKEAELSLAFLGTSGREAQVGRRLLWLELDHVENCGGMRHDAFNKILKKW